MDSGATPHIILFDNPKLYFRKHYFEVLDIISGELKHRFQQERGMPVAAALEKTLLDAAQNCFDALPSEIEMYNKDIDKQRLAIQLKMLPDLVRNYNERNPVTAIKKVSTLRTLCEIMNDVTSSKTMFSEVLTLLRIVLTIPVTSATAERAFSALRRLKTFLRSSMSQVRLNHVMLLHIHKERTDKLRLLDVANCFISVNDRRKFFWKLLKFMSCHYQCVCIHGREITCTCVLLRYYNKPCANCVRVTTGGVCVYTYNNGGKLNSEMLPERFLLPEKKGSAEITISCFAASEPGPPSLKTVPTPLVCF